jgi:hypothetical protein
MLFAGMAVLLGVLDPEDDGIRNLKMLQTSCSTRQNHMPEDLNLQQHHCENLKSTIIHFLDLERVEPIFLATSTYSLQWQLKKSAKKCSQDFSAGPFNLRLTMFKIYHRYTLMRLHILRESTCTSHSQPQI